MVARRDPGRARLRVSAAIATSLGGLGPDATVLIAIVRQRLEPPPRHGRNAGPRAARRQPQVHR